MAIYGYVRLSAVKHERPPEAQIEQIGLKARELGGRLAGAFVERGDPGKKTAVLARPAGKEMLETLKAGDTVIVSRLDRLGYSMRDVHKTAAALGERGVRIYVLHALDGVLDLEPGIAKAILQLFALWAKADRTLRSERFTELAQWRKENGLAYGGVPTARRIVERNGVKVLEWDREQLQYIVEIAYRLPREGPAKVADDFWKRRIKDRRGRLWGKPVPRRESPVREVNRVLRCLLGRRNHTASPYQQFYRAARWFHRMKWKGLLPPPYCDLAVSMPEPKGYQEEPKPRNWTPGGTARREQQRAEAKAEHRAERLARWEKEKAERIERRVHKPAG
jgi:DNA invertase Pin-like site-specific DNA recombinase